jgi:hypothetical protein
MSTVQEAELGLVSRTTALQRIRIFRTREGKYRMSVSISHRAGELELHIATTRKQLREWASLDRLTRHIEEKYGPVPAITISLEAGEPTP